MVARRCHQRLLDHGVELPVPADINVANVFYKSSQILRNFDRYEYHIRGMHWLHFLGLLQQTHDHKDWLILTCQLENKRNSWIAFKIFYWSIMLNTFSYLIIFCWTDQGSKFRRNFVKFGNFGGGQKKNPKFCSTLIHVLYNFRLNFLLFILHIFVFNRCAVINHTNICLDLNVFLEKAYFMC